MYLVSGLGQIFKPRPKITPKPSPKAPPKPAPKEGRVSKNGHRRFCGAADDGAVACDLLLRVKFRRSFEEFLREVENAYVRWMERSTARRLIKNLTTDLKQWHQELLRASALDNDPIMISAGLFYRSANGAWLVERSDLRQYWRLIDL
jgi:hypothetical protein